MNEPESPAQPERIRLRYAGKCATCGAILAVNSYAFYVRGTKKAYCDDHPPAVNAPENPPAAAAGESLVAAGRTDGGPPPVDDPDLPSAIKVRYPGSCSACMRPLPRGADAFYIRAAKAMVCVECTRLEVALGLELNAPGAGATKMAEAAHRRHAEQLLAAYPMLGERLLENAKPTAEERAWARGADGERVVGKALDDFVREGRIEVLHDRLIPGTHSNIDHIVIGPRRLTVIDAKHYRGKAIRTRKVGEDRVLYVDGEDASHLVDGVRSQRAKLRAALGPEYDDVTEGILAFVGADHGLIGTFACRGIPCLPVKDAAARAVFSGWVPGNPRLKFEAGQRVALRDRIATAFPAYR